MSLYEELRRQGPAAFAEATGRSRYWELLNAEKASMLDPLSGMVRNDLVEDSRCAACDSDRPFGGFVKDGFTYVRCAVCGTVYLDPRPTEATMLRFWTSSPVAEAWLQILHHPAQREFDETKFARVLDALAKRGFGDGTVLDFGCSMGTFLALARQRGMRVAGVEPGAGARRAALEVFGLQIVADINDLDSEDRYDVITSWEVIEHTNDPLHHLAALRSRVAPGGCLVVLVGGNAASLANRIMRGSSAAFEFARYWYFTPESFTRLLTRAGWRVTTIEQVLNELDAVSAYLGYGNPYEPASFAEDVLPQSLLENLMRVIQDRGMGYKFLVTATPN